MKKSPLAVVSAFPIVMLISWTMFTPVNNGMIFNLKMSSSRGTNGTIKLFYDTAGTRIEVLSSMGAYSFNKTSLVKKSDPNTEYQIDDQHNTYSIVDVSNANTYQNSEPAVTTLIDTTTLNGYHCKHLKVVQGQNKWKVWNTKAIVQYKQFSAVMNKSKYIGNHGVHEALKLVGAEGFPVKTILVDGQETTTTELTSVEHKPLDPSLFIIPSDSTMGAVAPSYPVPHH